jgi:archaemetzincin
LPALWRYRILRTVSHELAHCFGLDHCVYYACIMQGSASLAEDARQPPYLCPVDLAKVLAATGSSGQKRDQALLEYCDQPGTKDNKHFAALGAWLRRSLQLASGSSSSLDGGLT